MPIRARLNKSKSAVCCECGNDPNSSLDMFDIQIGKEIFTVCDLCMSVIAEKAISAKCYTNGRTKSSLDMSLIRKRLNKTYKK